MPPTSNRPSRRQRLSAQCLVLCLGLLAGPAALPQSAVPPPAAGGLPNLGDGSDLSPASERRIGDRIARELYRDPDYIDDLVITDYVQTIWQPLLAAARQRGDLPAALDEAFAWDILLGRDRTINAFALPGGYFGLHLGLVGIVGNRDELASVLAHELSHVTQRHISRSMARQAAQAPWLMGAMILGMLAASRNPDAGQAAVIGGQAAAAQSQLNYSRDMEREADRMGFGVQTQAGFAPQGFVGMFEKLQQSSRLNDSGGFPYLRSHPLTSERIADMQTRVHQAAGAPSVPVATLEHAMVAARARVLSDAAVDVLRAWEQQALPANLTKQTATNRVGILYGATFAALKLRDYALAQSSLARLQEHLGADEAAQRLARLLALELSLAQSDPSRSQALRDALQSDASRAALILRSQVDRQWGQAEQAAQALQTWLADHARDAQAWQELAGADAALGRSVAAVRAEAEARAAQLDYAGALARLKAAQDLARQSQRRQDHFEASIVDTRARQIESVLREQSLER